MPPIYVGNGHRMTLTRVTRWARQETWTILSFHLKLFFEILCYLLLIMLLWWNVNGRQLQKFPLNCGNPVAAQDWWQMTLQAAALKRQFPALPCLRMIHISCQHVEGEFLCIACWNSRYHEHHLQSTNSSNLWSSPWSMHIFISIMWSYLSCILDISIYSIWLQIIQLLSWFPNCSKFT